jgi:phage internal scaffolding protein
VCREESLARQSEADQADINKILARFAKSGIVPMQELPGEYVDVSEVGDYREAVERVARMDAYFSQLPAEVRLKFENDPAALLDAVNDPARRSELESLGLVKPSEEVAAAAAAAAERKTETSKRKLAREIEAELDAEARAADARRGTKGPSGS